MNSLVQFARNCLDSSLHAQPSLHVDWYGGEPLLNVEFMENASESLQQLCKDNDYKYAASVISNGTCWPESVTSFVRRHSIRQVQLSFDGLKVNHNKRRRYRKEFDSAEGRSSFDETVSLADQLLDVVHVDLRFNVDQGNKEDLIPFVKFAKARGCLLYTSPSPRDKRQSRMPSSA